MSCSKSPRRWRTSQALPCASAGVLLLLLGACGGSGDEHSAAGTLDERGRARALAAADSTDATMGAAADWTPLASEHEAFSVDGTRTVRYGSDTRWVTRQVTGAGECSNGFFGGDPAIGVYKRCELGAADWVRIAGEGEGFAVTGTQTVRYGSGTQWVVRDVAERGECSNQFFGTDPLFGVVKQCERVGAAPPPPAANWVRIAVEGQAFSVSGTQAVRYGSGASWVTKTVTASGQCSNGFFGTDPLFGVVKQCERVGETAPPPATDWLRIADEGQPFSVAGTQSVRYGNGSSWVTLTVTNTGHCSNAFFGTDPLVGVVKRCEHVAAGAPPTPPSPPGYQAQPQTAFDAARFLTQASFGPTSADVQRVQSVGYTGWLSEQFAKNAGDRHVAFMNAVWQAEAPTTVAYLQDRHVATSLWKHAATGDDQLRQRVGFALSEILVVSLNGNGMAQHRRGVAAYLDMLNRHAFGNFRDVLEGAARSPAMGQFLTFLKNRKENPEGTRFPDQNFAREVMQLFTIGLVKLNPDGTPVLVDGKSVETYRSEDIDGLSRVFTGLSWGGADKSNTRFYAYYEVKLEDTWDTAPMEFFPQFHSTSEKRFLGKVIPASGTPDGDGDLRIALDTLFQHPNVGPFLGRQLIQRLVTSNPSPSYVRRVAQAFETGTYTLGSWTTGTGRRGDLGATVAAVLLDPDARDPARTSDPAFGKVREPVLRVTNWMRAFKAAPSSGEWSINSTFDAVSSLNQQPMRAPSVFNFFRPGYVPPNTALAERKLVAPELQITDEVSVVGYANALRDFTRGNFFNIVADYSNELPLASDPDQLIDRLNLLLLHGSLTDNTRTTIREAVRSIALPTSGDQSVARDRRVRMAVWLAMSAPEFLVQQ